MLERTIKNVVATAYALATKAGSCVKFSYPQKVAVSEKFTRDFNGAEHAERMVL
jgi:hypothetical protein